ncbi:hypothetical protein [Candidimonas nitroreducens]|uniref:Integrase n=1 Tax=Candidimonas nitroreducens TaxID=683354 RepID=A0A225MRD4_9BURK|nr:hypothetical protein [Candidimonas nitroreducens]OWT62031.1 hypothetical protein CEY11_09505 [Candidimonas nitroreducens]
MNTFELMARAWLESASKDRVWSAGYKSKVTRHLAHVSKEELGASYDRATFLAQSKMMVQQWTDFLDELEAGKMPKLAENVLWLKQA